MGMGGGMMGGGMMGGGMMGGGGGGIFLATPFFAKLIHNIRIWLWSKEA